MTPSQFSGGCLCGAIRYECSAQPMAMFNCHCRACQQISGGPYLPVVLVPAGAFRLTRGELRHHFTDSAMIGEHKRGFCGDCGSRVTGGEGREATPWIGVTASSLDDPGWFRPQFDSWTASAQPWDVLGTGRPLHPRYPPNE